MLDLIFAEVHTRAARHGGLINIRGAHGSWQSALPALERQLLRDLESTPNFRRQLHNEVDRVLRSEHLVRIDPAAASVPVVDTSAPAPVDGVLKIRSCIGLGTATVLESEPEQWCTFVAQKIFAHAFAGELDVTLDCDAVRVYAVGAGAGGLARAVSALEPPGRVEVEEYDPVLLEGTALPCVVGSRIGVRVHQRYEAVVMVVPAPGRGGGVNHRRIYRRDRDSDIDLSATGAAKWMALVAAQLEAVRELTEDDGLVFVLVPASVRSEDHYEPAPQLLDAFLESAARAGLVVIERHRVVEIEPVNQPFVGRRRADRWSVLLRPEAKTDA